MKLETAVERVRLSDCPIACRYAMLFAFAADKCAAGAEKTKDQAPRLRKDCLEATSTTSGPKGLRASTGWKRTSRMR